MVTAGKKRASPGAEEEKNPFEVDISDEVHEKLQQAAKAISRVELALERNAQKKLVPAYQRRREIVKTVTKFWPVALMNNITFSMQCQHPDDQKALQYLTDVWVEREPQEPRVFTLEFHFSENPYFSDAVLKKVYQYKKPDVKDDKPDEDGITQATLDFDWERDVEAQVTKVSWKDESKNLVKMHPRQLEEDGGVAEPGSFFNYFETADDAFELGHLVANEVFPEAIDWFTGVAGSVEMDSDMDSEEEDDDDDDEGEIDLEKPRAKKQKHA